MHVAGMIVLSMPRMLISLKKLRSVCRPPAVSGLAAAKAV